MAPAPAARESYDCLALPAFAGGDVHEVRAAFRSAMPIPLAQAWLDEPEPDFTPGVVRTGWRDDTLLVFAVLSDADIFTRATAPNGRFWELGDTFEMFLQPQPGQGYVEFHVTPNNLRLQLGFAGPLSPDAGVDPFSQALIPRDVFRSWTWINAIAREWSVLAEIPATAAGWSPRSSAARAESRADLGPSLAGSTWRVSFCRYDYTSGRTQPVISSSSPHTEPRFHRPHEWNELRFKSA